MVARIRNSCPEYLTVKASIYYWRQQLKKCHDDDRFHMICLKLGLWEERLQALRAAGKVLWPIARAPKPPKTTLTVTQWVPAPLSWD